VVGFSTNPIKRANKASTSQISVQHTCCETIMQCFKQLLQGEPKQYIWNSLYRWKRSR